MALWGTIVNAAAIIVGGLLGLVLHRMSEGIRSTVIQGIGLALLVLGVSMALKSTNFLLVVASLVIGGIAGELLQVERGLERLGGQLERGVHKVSGLWQKRADTLLSSATTTDKSEEKIRGRIAVGFVNTTLIYCVGAMAILGALDGGLRGQHDILYTKAMLDGFLSIIFASTLGVGVLFSAIPVFLYQGMIAVAASGITELIEQTLLNEIITQLTAVGGVLIMGLGLNLLEVRKIHVANLLPSLLIAALGVPIVHWASSWW
ncbi:DUF554 domain-containing protein [Paenibacillus radicis (ex Xue et al. 2023)]|uniref:DUF554 domain-containing protein n=1 Tax=Paenibacillus radicis (ex Xue et al. 2023) TaxID=2972489 RepID=A0ABT1YKZ3_9BACL|nr:DUF554 domain-containing protein [Paenibacillus radicis (ex Xue et al. 2023)]MCR8633848.1 DUF554 domain-containing protein [Paenibacillus radicis (ex Xue et al. 2023)]